MNHNAMAKLGSLICVAMLSFAMVAGCANSAISAATSEQQENRAYMSQVNEIMVKLDEGLDSFVDAVSRDDVVNMRTQADNAFQALDQLQGLEAPEELADVQEKYAQGTEKLRQALNEYIALYTEMNAGSLDRAKYDVRIAEIQATYDAGVKLLEEGDETAAGKE